MKDVKQIMILDDDGTINFVTEKLLLHYNKNYQVTSFTDPDIALASLKDKYNHAELLPDIIFLDINMPKLSGFDFLDRVAQYGFGNKMQVIMYTSSNSILDKKKSELYKNVIGYMEKPFSAHAYNKMLDTVAVRD